MMFWTLVMITRVPRGGSEAFLPVGLIFRANESVWNPNGWLKRFKVVHYAVCWCILPL